MAKTTATRGRELDRAGLSDEQLVAMLRNMLLQRQLDNRGFQLNRQGKIPFALGSEGHEAVQAGAAMAFKRGTDVLVPYYRDLGLALGVGMTPFEILSSLFARVTDRSMGRQFPNHYTNHDLGVLSISSIIAGHCTHAVGVAAAFKYRGEAGRAVICTTGEGATSQGEWHESVNYAAVQALPIVFLVENNEWAISTPQDMQMNVANVADKAPALRPARRRLRRLQPGRDLRGGARGARARAHRRRPVDRRGEVLPVPLALDRRRRPHLPLARERSRSAASSTRSRASSRC